MPTNYPLTLSPYPLHAIPFALTPSPYPLHPIPFALTPSRSLSNLARPHSKPEQALDLSKLLNQF